MRHRKRTREVSCLETRVAMLSIAIDLQVLKSTNPVVTVETGPLINDARARQGTIISIPAL